MTTSIGIQNPAACAEGDLIYISEFGVLDARSFDLKSRRYQGRMYKLAAEGARSISEALAFTARFDSAAVRTAYVDLNSIESKITFEMARNTRPNEIGLRYAGDRWIAQDAGSKNAIDTLRPWLSTSYVARSLPERSLFAIAEVVRMKVDDLSSTFVRVNFKEQTLSLIVEESRKVKLPGGHFLGFSLPEIGMSLIASSDTACHNPKERKEMSDTRIEQKTTAQDAHTGQAKYMTYSRSEVDRLIKQQVEALQSSLLQKINSQQKSAQEEMSAHTRSIKETVDQAVKRLETLTFDFEKQKDRQSEEALTKMEALKKQFQSELVVFRGDANKAARENLKAIEENVNTVKTLIADAQAPRKEKSQPTIVWIVAAVGALTLINTILLFLRH